ncbi:lipopolysaccharide kinase InaA family protein [Streptomyces sp. NPDC047028]|uniref:lipopolysaccharide kinase InaA family protein n=1 Tax=Streptomyces sp. NPDC047028 TaxID=3155793 RepID=UPI0033FA9796
MTAVQMAWVLPDKLGRYTDHSLGNGGQGIVYGVPDPPGRFAGEYLAYKEYLPVVSYDADVLHDMVCFRQLLGPADRAFLDERTTWPLALVYRGDTPTDPLPSRNPSTKVTGFLMHRVTPAYELHSPVLGGAQLQALEYLLNVDDYGRRIGLVVDDTRRVELLLDLARTIAWLHKHRIVVGDLSPKNVLFTLQGAARCLLIDCDSMRHKGKDVLDQVDTPSWEVPEALKATTAADSWKFGLLALRLFNRDQDDRDPGPLRALSTGLAGLANRAQNADPGRRPALAEWLPELELAHDRLRRRPTPPPAPKPTPTPPSPQPVPPRPVPPRPTPPRPTPPRPAPPRPAAASTGKRVAGWLLAALLVGAIGGYTVTHMRNTGDSQATPSSTTPTADTYRDDDSGSGSGPTPSDTTPTPTESKDPTLVVAKGASVDFSAVADDSRAPHVAGMFAAFFGAVNQHRYDTALRYYDPGSGIVDLGSDSSRADWKKVMSTTQDSEFVLNSLQSDSGYTLATLSFRSHQDAGYGPASSPDDTCDDWTITYQLTHSKGYRIYKAPREGVSYTPC